MASCPMVNQTNTSEESTVTAYNRGSHSIDDRYLVLCLTVYGAHSITDTIQIHYFKPIFNICDVRQLLS